MLGYALILIAIVMAGAAAWQFLPRDRSAARRSGEVTGPGAADYASMLNALGDAIYLREEGGRVLHANPACAQLLGLQDPAEMRGQNILEFFRDVSEATLSKENELVLSARTNMAQVLQECSVTRRDGRSFPAEKRVSRCRYGDTAAVLVQMRDVSERKQYEELMVQHVTVDEVTRLPNRRLMMDRLRQAIILGKRGGGNFAVMLIDLDHFKRINDSRGHTLGDALLSGAAQRLRETVREADTVARFGGDEFVVILTEPDPSAAPLRVEYAAQRVVQAFQEPFLVDGLQAVVTASVGIALWPADGDDPDTLMRNADTAMYEVKKSSRNSFCLFNREMNQRVQDSLRIDAHLRQALERKEMRVLFQPIVEASTGRMMKVEALLRWQSAELGNVPPDQFIPVAEETGQIVAIGLWVLEESCRRVRELQAVREDSVPLTVSVNVSARQLQDERFASIVSDVLRITGLPANQLELELTERIIIDDDRAVLANITALHEMGISLSLDDFGTGYSSLSYLTRFPLNTVKLDRAFVRDIEFNMQSLHLATAIIAMCRSLGLALVAEGIETQPQAELLGNHGCRYLQGYHFSRPVNPADIPQIAGFQPRRLASVA
ncbi:putative bifunctional diguanylate cyclase/phosphodiesterase [Viridibacterium curvum]|uniref:EAL domain-containing protein n=1 Tax=Viridibacterium curvum TaxID=1101404 RepID=A0ABP9QQ83_9RHOO